MSIKAHKYLDCWGCAHRWGGGDVRDDGFYSQKL